MLITKEVEVKWYYRTKDHYENLGYIFTNFNDSFIVPIKHLHEGSSALVELKCDYCDKPLSKTYKDYLNQNTKTIIHTDSCNKCKGLKQIEGCQLKYGVNSVSQVKEIRERQIIGVTTKYGVKNISQLQEIKDKKINTSLYNYGVEYYTQTLEFAKVFSETCLRKFGTEAPMQNKDIQDKSKTTCLEKYGFENVFQNEDIKNKSKETIMNKYGVENISQVPEIMKDARIKANKTLSINGTAPCSSQQLFLHNVIGGTLNYPVNTSILDIAYIKENIYVEADFSGHNLSVVCNNITQDQFDTKEKRRYYVLKNIGWSMIRIISLNDRLPSENILTKMIDYAKEHLKSGHSWIKFDIDNSKVITSQYEKHYEFGELKKISKKDLQNNKQL